MSNIRSVFISDCHLGSQFAHTDQLLRYLKWVKDAKPDYLYIVGDFIDGWKLSRNWWWSNDCNLVIRKLLSIVKSGTEVRYVAGNHDEFLRYFLGESSELLLVTFTSKMNLFMKMYLVEVI
jgi:UDP-2,3-diacylglucosamine pyrophosphatase LpxH